MRTDSSPRAMVGLASFGFFVFGASMTLPGALLPVIIEQFNIRLMSAGTLMAAAPMGYLAAVAIAGLLSHRFGGKYVLALGVAMTGVGAVLFGLTTNFYLAVFFMALAGIGGGAVEVVANVLLIQASGGQSGKYLNFGHLFFGVGAFVTPPLATYAVSGGIPTSTVFAAMGVLAAIMVLLVIALPFPSKETEGDTETTEEKETKISRSPAVLLIGAALGIYVGFELGVGSWITKYFTEVHQTSLVFAGNALSAYWVALAVGRLIMAMMKDPKRDDYAILGLGAFATVMSIGGVLLSSPWGSAIAFAGMGLGCSGIYPFIISWGGKMFPSRVAIVTGVLATGGAIGGVGIPWIMAAIADQVGLRWGMLFYSAAGMMLLVLILTVMRLHPANGKKLRI